MLLLRHVAVDVHLEERVHRLRGQRHDSEVGIEGLQVGSGRILGVVHQDLIEDRLALVDRRAVDRDFDLGRIVVGRRPRQPRERRCRRQDAENDVPAVVSHVGHQSLSTFSGR